MINIVVTSRPSDGLLHYSYEHFRRLKDEGVAVSLVIIPRDNFTNESYIDSIKKKYHSVTTEDIFFDYFYDPDDITLIMGRSMLVLPYLDYKNYNEDNRFTLHELFKCPLIAVYAENHPIEVWDAAVKFWGPKSIDHLCDTEVYLNGIGDHFEKTIHFEYYKDPVFDPKISFLFLGTSKDYYEIAEKRCTTYPNYGILTYDSKYLNKDLNNIFAPVDNLLGLFETYVYTKQTFDPAPRLMQECKYYGKSLIYDRPRMHDGGSVYMNREIVRPNIEPILKFVK